MPKPASMLAAYLLAMAGVAIVLAAGLLLWPWLRWSMAPFFVFAVVFAAWYGGTGPALLATLLSALAIKVFFIAPYYSFTLAADDTAWLLAFFLIAGAVIVLFETRRRAERALWKESESFRVTLGSIGDAVITTDVAGRIGFMNAVAEKLTGWSRSEALGRPIDEVLTIIDETTRKPAPNPVAAALEEGSATGLANHACLVARDGVERPIEDSAAPIRDDEGRLLGVVLVFHDVTERRRGERALRESEEKLRYALEVANMGIWDWDVGSNSLAWTSRLEPSHGFVPGTFPGTLDAFMDRIHPDDRPRLARAIESALERGARYDEEFRVVWPDGSVHWIAGKGHAAYDGQGKPLRMIGVALDVTKPKQAEEDLRALNETLEQRVAERTRAAEEAVAALAESEALYRTIGESVAYGIWVCEPDGRVRYLSQSFLQLLGKTLDECRDRRWFDLLPPDEVERTRAAWEQAIANDDNWDWEMTVQGVDGRYRTILSRGRQVWDSEGRPQGWAGVNLDITGRKQSEEALRRETGFVRLLQTVAVAANEAATVKDAMQTCLRVVCQHTGWPLGHAFRVDEEGILTSMDIWCARDEPVRAKFREVTRELRLPVGEGFPGLVGSTGAPMWIHEVADHSEFRRKMAAREAGLRSAFAFPVMVGRSVEAVLEFFATEVVDPDVALLDVMGHVGTQLGRVIERTRAEEAQTHLLAQTEAAEARFRRLLESAPDSVILADEQGRITLVNTQTEKLFGYNRDDLIGLSVDALVPERFRHGHGAHRAHYARHPQRRSMGLGRELFGRRADGSEFPVEISLSPLDTPEGMLVMSIVRDITERKRLEEALRQSERLAAIGQMITGLSHESRNALQRSLACLEMLDRKVQDQPAARRLLEEAQKAQKDLRQVYEEVREYAAPVVLQRRPERLEDTWREAWETLVPLREGRCAELHEHVNGVDTTCDVDPFRMQQVFRNLMENSLAACGDPARISIDCEEAPTHGHMLRVTVRDNGPGLDKKQEERIFEPFYTTKAKGTGLGMAIVKRIVESHGGRIDVNADAPQGFELTILLPRRST